MTDDIDYSRAEKGRKESLEGTVQQLGYHVELYPSVKDALNRRGFTEQQFERMATLRQMLDTQEAMRHEGRGGARLALAEEAEARSELKSIKRDLDSTLMDLFAEGAGLGVDRDAFLAKGPIGNSTPKLSAYFARIDLSLERIASALAVYNDGRNLHAEARAARARLDAAQATQETSIRLLPEETVKIYALKGEAFGLIEKFNRAGKRAFEGRADKIALFNKDLILRSRKQKKAPAEVGTGT